MGALGSMSFMPRYNFQLNSVNIKLPGHEMLPLPSSHLITLAFNSRDLVANQYEK